MVISLMYGIFSCSILFGILYGIVYVLMKIYNRDISPKLPYYIWTLTMAPLLFSFLPLKSIFSYRFPDIWASLPWLNSSVVAHTEHLSHTSTTGTASQFLQDFSISVNRTPMSFVYVICIVWLLGLLFMLAAMMRSFFWMYQMKKNATVIKNAEIHSVFKECNRIFRIKKQIVLCASNQIESPITFGLGKTYIILPQSKVEQFTKRELTYIFLHELAHYKNKDYLINLIVGLVHSMYWFHPLVWFTVKEIKATREISCDCSVLEVLDETQITEYGYTLLNFLATKQRRYSPVAALEISSTKKQITRRISQIASFQKENGHPYGKNIALLMVVILLSLSTMPAIAIASSDRYYYDFSDTQTTYVDLGSFFQGYEGSFVLYDTKEELYTIYNESKSKTRVSPNSTYKIYSGLMALENKVITTEDSYIPWNGVEYPYDAWETGQTLETGLSSSVSWYFQELDRQVGAKLVQKYLVQMNYGNCNVFAPIDEYWMESSLKISPIEQVELLKALYFNTLDFQDKNMEYVKNAIRLSTSDAATLYGKTGTGTVNEKQVNGWFIGFVEMSDRTYVFATNIEAKANASGTSARQITLDVLKYLGIPVTI